LVGGGIGSPSAPQHNGTDRTPQGEVRKKLEKKVADPRMGETERERYAHQPKQEKEN